MERDELIAFADAWLERERLDDEESVGFPQWFAETYPDGDMNVNVAYWERWKGTIR